MQNKQIFFQKNSQKKANFMKKKENEKEIIEDNNRANYFDTQNSMFKTMNESEGKMVFLKKF